MPTWIDAAWCIAVGTSFLGYGLALLQLLKKDQESWVTATAAGMGVFTFLLAVLNLLGKIGPNPLFILVLIGNLGFLFNRKSLRAAPAVPDTRIKDGMTAKLATCAALALAGCLALTGLHSRIVNAFDDSQAYFAYPLEALQTGALQPQPLSERRINTSLGANYLLDAVLAVDGDIRSVSFLDQTLGFILYIAAIWIVGRKLMFSFGRQGVLLALVLLLPMVQVNATAVYLQSGVALCLLLAMHEATKAAVADWRSGILVGVIGSTLCLTKSSGIVFFFFLVSVFAVMHSTRLHNLVSIRNAFVAGTTVLILSLPWMVQQHRNEGTYLSPILGSGFHASHWGMVPLPRQTASLPIIAIVVLPDVGALLLAAFLAWKLRSRSRSFDVSLISFILAALVTTPVIGFSTAGEAVDRFTFPFHIPAVILLSALVLASPLSELQPWRRAAQAFLVVWIIAIVAVSARHHRTYLRSLHRVEDALSIAIDKPLFDELVLDDHTMLAEEERARTAQNMVPAGEQIVEATLFAYPYDFRRNRVLIADYPGMAGWAPGIPVGRGPTPVRDYLLNHNLHYFLCDRRLTYNNEDIGEFLRHPVLDATLHDLAFHHIHHEIFPWSRMEWMVSRDVRHNLVAIADTGTRLYDDGTLVLVRLPDQ